MTVLLWRERYARAGLAGLGDEPRPGRPPTYSREDRDRVIALTLESPSDGTTHWSARRLGQRLGMSETTVWRIWQSVGSSRTGSRRSSSAPIPISRPRSATSSGCISRHPSGRSSSPSTRRPRSRRSTGPSRCCPCGRGRSPARPRLQAQRHDQPVRRAQRRDRRGDPGGSGAPHRRLPGLPAADRPRLPGPGAARRPRQRQHPKTPDVRAWLERHPRITFHFTPTSASWMNQVETWFSVLSRQAIRRGSFSSVKELIAMIDTFTASWNEGGTPFTWTRTADDILAKAVRKRPATSQIGRSAPRRPAAPRPPTRSWLPGMPRDRGGHRATAQGAAQPDRPEEPDDQGRHPAEQERHLDARRRGDRGGDQRPERARADEDRRVDADDATAQLVGRRQLVRHVGADRHRDASHPAEEQEHGGGRIRGRQAEAGDRHADQDRPAHDHPRPDALPEGRATARR